jgi:hypothetical protein
MASGASFPGAPLISQRNYAMDRLASSFIARSDPSIKSGESSDNIVVLQNEKSISNKNTTVVNLIFTHKPASEVFKNPDLLASAKLAHAEIKQQLIASGKVSQIKAEEILDKMKYGSADLDPHGIGKDAQEVLGSSAFHLMAKALKIDIGKTRFDDTTKTLNAGASKPRAKRGTGVFQPSGIQTGRSTANPQKGATAANAKLPPAKKESSHDDFIFSTFPSDLDSGASLLDTASEKNKASSSSTSSGWRAAKPTTARPQQSAMTQATPSSSSNEKKS